MRNKKKWIISMSVLLGLTAFSVARAVPNFTSGINVSSGESTFNSIDRIGPLSNNPERGSWNPIWSSIGAGRALFADEEFETSGNDVYVYNNSGGDGVQIFWENGDGSQPNRTGKWLRIYHNGNAASPGFGGFITSFTCRRNATFVQRFRAKLPAGYYVNNAENSMGNNSTLYWITSRAGTGKWEEYIRIAHCGNSGTFSGGGHVYVTGPSAAFTWYLASANVYEIDSPPGIFSGKVGIGKNNPATALDVNGIVTATGFSGSYSGTLNAANLSSGTFGANTGGGNYSFSSNLGVGTTVPKHRVDVVGSLGVGLSAANFSDEGYNLHIWSSDINQYPYGQGSQPANLAIEENDAEQSIAFLGPNTATQKIVFGRASDPGVGQISFNHNTNQFGFTGGNVVLGDSANYTVSSFRSSGMFLKTDTLDSQANGDSLELQYDVAGNVVVYGADSNLIVQGTGNSTFAGNVGIGTASPAAPLNIYKDPTGGFVEQLRIGGTGNYRSLDLGTYGAYGGYISTYGNDLYILSGRGVSNENHNIHFYTSFSGAGGEAENNERMTILHNGNVGIGVTNPYTKFHVRSNSILHLGLGGAMAGVPTLQTDPSDALALYGVDGGGYTDYRFYVEDDANDSISFWGNSCGRAGCFNVSNDVAIMKLQADGNVGIGNTSPTYKLDVAGNGAFRSGDNSYLYFGPNGSWGGSLYVGATPSKISNNVAQVISTDGNLHLDSGSNNSMYLNYYSARPVGIYGPVTVNNSVTATSFSGAYAGTISAANVSAGTFGGNTGGGSFRFPGNIYTDANFGYGLVGVYTSDRYQGVFSMGDSYKLPADGSTTGNLYGLAWSHPNAGGVASNLNTHGLLVMENGTFLAAVSGSIRARDDMRAPIFYDSNNTGYYIDPNSYSNAWMLNRQRGYDSVEYDYNDTAYYIDPNGSSRFNYMGRNYGYNWTEYDWNDGAYYVDPNQTSLFNDLRANIFYDRQDTGYYLDPNGTSNLGRVTNRTKVSLGSSGIYNTPRWDYTADTGYWTGAMGWGNTDLNTIFSNWGSGFWDSWGSPANAPGGSSHYVGMQSFHYAHQNSSSAYGWQMALAGEADNRFFWRSGWPSLRGWVEMIHSGNIGSQSVSYAATAGSATNAGNADTLDGYHYNGLPYSPKWNDGWGPYDGNSIGASKSGFTYASNAPWSGPLVRFDASGYDLELNAIYHGNGYGISYRTRNGDAASWNSWFRLYSDTYRPYADSAGNSDTVDGVHASSFVSKDTWWGSTYYGSDGNVYLGWNSRWLSETINQDVRNGASPTFYNVTATNAFLYSDLTLKKDILTISNPIDKIMQLRGVTFNWKKDDTASIGVIAQEVEKVFPELVSESDGKKTVQYGNLVAPLIEAVKAQQEEIEDLRNDVSGLKAIIADINKK